MAQQYAKDQPAGFTNRIQNVAVVGATGSVGEHITQQLLKNGKHTVTAITRANSKSKMPDGVKVAQVDYDDESTIIEALKGQDALVITMSTSAREAQGKLIEAAAKAKVQWIIPNEYGPDVTEQVEMGKDTGLGPGVWAAHEHIEKLGVSNWIGFSCSFWYEFSLAVSPYAYGFDLKNKKVTLIDDGKTKINTSTWAQCGRAVAALFSLPTFPQDENDKGPYLAMWSNKTLYISSFLLSQRDMLDSVLRVTGDKESEWTVDREDAEERFKAGQGFMKSGEFMRGFQTCMYTRLFYKDGSGDFSAKLDNAKLGLPKEDLDEATKEAIDMVNSGYNYFNRG